MRALAKRVAIISMICGGLIQGQAIAEETTSDGGDTSADAAEAVGGGNCMRTCLDDGEDFDICRESCVAIAQAPWRDDRRVACR